MRQTFIKLAIKYCINLHIIISMLWQSAYLAENIFSLILSEIYDLYNIMGYVVTAFMKTWRKQTWRDWSVNNVSLILKCLETFHRLKYFSCDFCDYGNYIYKWIPIKFKTLDILKVYCRDMGCILSSNNIYSLISVMRCFDLFNCDA